MNNVLVLVMVVYVAILVGAHIYVTNKRAGMIEHLNSSDSLPRIVFKDKTPTTVTVSWAAPTLVSGERLLSYTLKRKGDGDTEFRVVYTGPAPSFADGKDKKNPLSPGSKYAYIVHAKTSAGEKPITIETVHETDYVTTEFLVTIGGTFGLAASSMSSCCLLGLLILAMGM